MLFSECDICGRPFKNQQQLAKHRMTHLNPSERLEYRCSFCHIMLDTIKLKEKHEERHREGETFECESCERKFKNEKNLSHHIKMHHTPKKSTDRSISSSKSQGKKKVNKPETDCSNTPPKSTTHIHVCHLCGPPKMFCLTSLRRHLARIHSQNFKCSRTECGRFFKEKVQLEAHEETHRMRECHLCGRKFQRKQNADIHLMGVHHLKTDDLERLGRWNPRGDDPTKCPEYLVRSIRNTIKKKDREKRISSVGSPATSDIITEDILDEEEIIIKEEPINIGENNS